MFLPTTRAGLADSISEAMAAAPPEIALPAIDSLLAWSKNRQKEAVSRLKAPTGLITTVGGRGRTTRFQQARQGLPELGIEEIPGSGHFLMLEVPDAFNNRFRAMLGRVGQRGVS
jgi:pimeloyl-ACP methyl ester carboxylesterase